MSTITATHARSNLFQLIKNTIRGHQMTRISSKEGNVVMLSETDYEDIMETAELLSIPGLEQSVRESQKQIEAGETYTFDEVFA